MRSGFLALVLVMVCQSAWGQQASSPPTADAIMARVAANQDSSQAERSHYIYVQHARVRSRKGKTIMCEEITDSRIIPSASGSQQKLLKLDGRVRHKGHYLTYTQLLPPRQKGETKAVTEHEDFETLDRGLVENMRTDLTNEKSKDGIGTGLFPLTSKDLPYYEFHLLGREQMNGRNVFHIEFRPKDKGDVVWKGDAYIDTTAFEPVVVRTAMARRIPFAVRTLLGTSLPGLGFTVVYAPQPDGVWFPTSFGTEFKVHVLFFFRRQITVDAEYRDFRKTHVTSHIVGDSVTTAVPPKPQQQP